MSTPGSAVLYTRIPAELKERVTRYAEANGLTIAAATKRLLESGLTMATSHVNPVSFT